MALPVSEFPSPIAPLHYQQAVDLPSTTTTTTHPPSAFSTYHSTTRAGGNKSFNTPQHQRTRTAIPSRSGSLPPIASASSSSSPSLSPSPSHRKTTFQLHSSTTAPIVVRKPNRERSGSRDTALSGRNSPPKPTLPRLQTSGSGSSGLNMVSTSTPMASTSSSSATPSSSSNSGHSARSMPRSVREIASTSISALHRPLPPPPPPLSYAPMPSVESQSTKQVPARKRSSTVDVLPSNSNKPVPLKSEPIEAPRIQITTTPTLPPSSHSASQLSLAAVNAAAAASALRPLPPVPPALLNHKHLSPPVSPSGSGARRNVSSPPRMNRRRIGGPRAVVEGQRQGRRAPQLAFDPMSSTWVIQPSSPSRMPYSPFSHNGHSSRRPGLNTNPTSGHARSQSDHSIRASAAAKGKGKAVARDDDDTLSPSSPPPVPARPPAATAPNSPVLGGSSPAGPLMRHYTDPALLQMQGSSSSSSPSLLGGSLNRKEPRGSIHIYETSARKSGAAQMPDWLADVAPLRPRKQDTGYHEMTFRTDSPGFMRSDSPIILEDPIREQEAEEEDQEIEVFVDDGYTPDADGTDEYTSLVSSHPSERSRSPSPIRYARPDELGLLDSDEEYWGMTAEREEEDSLSDIGDSMEFSKNPSPIERTYVLAYPSGQEVVRGNTFPTVAKGLEDDEEEEVMSSTTASSRRRTKSGGSFPSSAELRRLEERYSNGNSPIGQVPSHGAYPWALQDSAPQPKANSSSGHSFSARGPLKMTLGSLEPKRRDTQDVVRVQTKKKRSSQGFFFGVRESSPKGSYSPDRKADGGDLEVARGRQSRK